MPPPEGLPDGFMSLCTVFRTVERQRSKTWTRDGNMYLQVRILKIIDGAAAGVWGTGGGAVNDSVACRKTVHCGHRFVVSVITDKHGDYMIRGRKKATLGELDAGQVRDKHGTWQRLVKISMDEALTVSSGEALGSCQDFARVMSCTWLYMTSVWVLHLNLDATACFYSFHADAVCRLEAPWVFGAR